MTVYFINTFLLLTDLIVAENRSHVITRVELIKEKGKIQKYDTIDLSIYYTCY